MENSLGLAKKKQTFRPLKRRVFVKLFLKELIIKASAGEHVEDKSLFFTTLFWSTKKKDLFMVPDLFSFINVIVRLQKF